MERSHLINILKNHAITVSKEKKIAPSIIVAESIYTLYNEDLYDNIEKLINNNNPFAIKAGKRFKGKTFNLNNIKYKVFDSLESGISTYISNNESRRFNKIKNIFRYQDAISKDDTLSEDKSNRLLSFIEAYKLYDLDEEFINQFIYTFTKNVVEVPTQNDNTLFYQKMHNCEPEREKITPELVRIHESEKKEKKVNIQRGDKITLKNANLYQKINSKIPTRSISGEYYISTKIEKNRCGVVMKPEYVNKDIYILGYINISQIK